MDLIYWICFGNIVESSDADLQAVDIDLSNWLRIKFWWFGYRLYAPYMCVTHAPHRTNVHDMRNFHNSGRFFYVNPIYSSGKSLFDFFFLQNFKSDFFDTLIRIFNQQIYFIQIFSTFFEWNFFVFRLRTDQVIFTSIFHHTPNCSTKPTFECTKIGFYFGNFMKRFTFYEINFCFLTINQMDFEPRLFFFRCTFC